MASCALIKAVKNMLCFYYNTCSRICNYGMHRPLNVCHHRPPKECDKQLSMQASNYTQLTTIS